MNVFLAALVGFWSLCGQFILNRVIFFYVANSEYAAASIISLHLLGFLLGSLAARNYRISIPSLVAASLALTVSAQLLLWTYGVTTFGLIPTLVMALVFALLLAFFSGFLVIRLMEARAAGTSATPIIIADSAGSVIGAMVGGFILVPKFGLQASFMLMAFVQAISLLLVSHKSARRVLASAAAICVATVLLLPGLLQAPAAEKVLSVEGFPLRTKTTKQALLSERRSPFGILSVLESENGHRELRIDSRTLCGVFKDPQENTTMSEWVVGAMPARLSLTNAAVPRVAVVGLGCGMTLAAVLAELPPEKATVDMIEINPEMEEMQKQFRGYLPHGPDDPRVTFVLRDGFAHFADLPSATRYDAVAIDVAWMANMNATHLFSKEMYENVATHMTDRAILGVWSEETNPFSKISLILYRTLKAVFQEVRIDVSHGVVLFYAAKAAAPGLAGALPPEGVELSNWIEMASREAPINRLDDLVMNRHKFSLWGDSIFERLRERYDQMRLELESNEHAQH